jgi:hypothetical protein
MWLEANTPEGNMRIVIEHETAGTDAAVSAAATIAPVQAENAGAAAAAAGGGDVAAGDDGGGPPAWLVEAVQRAIATAEGPTSSVTAADATDAGAAPEQ